MEGLAARPHSEVFAAGRPQLKPVPSRPPPPTHHHATRSLILALIRENGSKRGRESKGDGSPGESRKRQRKALPRSPHPAPGFPLQRGRPPSPAPKLTRQRPEPSWQAAESRRARLPGQTRCPRAGCSCSPLARLGPSLSPHHQPPLGSRPPLQLLVPLRGACASCSASPPRPLQLPLVIAASRVLPTGRELRSSAASRSRGGRAGQFVGPVPTLRLPTCRRPRAPAAPESTAAGRQRASRGCLARGCDRPGQCWGWDGVCPWEWETRQGRPPLTPPVTAGERDTRWTKSLRKAWAGQNKERGRGGARRWAEDGGQH